MELSTKYGFKLPNSANDEIADINDISDNFRIIDEFMDDADENIGTLAANALAKTLHGTSVLVDNPSPNKHRMEVSVASKNLISLPYKDGSKTVDGLTITVQDDGTIVLNGTASQEESTSTIVFNVTEDKQITLNKHQAYTFSGGFTWASACASAIVYNGKFSQTVYGDNADEVTDGQLASACTIEQNQDFPVGIRLEFQRGYPFDNVKIRPQLEVGNVRTENTPHISDLTSVSVIRKSPNLIDLNEIKLDTATGAADLTLLEDGFTFSNAGKTKDGTYARAYIDLPLIKGGYYIRAFGSQSDGNGSFGFSIYDIENKKDVLEHGNWGRINDAFSVPESKTYRVFFTLNGYSKKGTTIKYTEVQLERGDRVSTYAKRPPSETYHPDASGVVSGVTSWNVPSVITTDNEGAVVTVKYCEDLVNTDFTTRGAAALTHRNLWRGKYLGSEFTAAQKSAIASGTFDDLFVGDYWSIGDIKYRIADINYYLNTGDNQTLTENHLVIVPDALNGNDTTGKINSADTQVGAYAQCELRTASGSVMSKIKLLFQTAFGSNSIVNYRNLFVNAVSNGLPTGQAWYNADVELMSELQVFGTKIFSASMASSNTWLSFGTIDTQQFALFRLQPSFIANGQSYWLRDTVGNRGWAFVQHTGQPAVSIPTSGLKLRPYFLLKG